MIPALGVIPVRFESRRFPGKPLAAIHGKAMIQWVFEQASQAKHLAKLVVATDDERILSKAQEFGAQACLTSPRHRSGTDRVAEVAEAHEFPIVINIQGDEPLLRSRDIDRLVETLQDPDVPLATLAHRNPDLSCQSDPNKVKVVMDIQRNALYFSRSPIPHASTEFFWEHIGIYGYQKDVLRRFCSWPPSPMERLERLEQLRVLENGYRIRVLDTEFSSLSVDTPEDIIKVEKMITKQSHGC